MGEHVRASRPVGRGRRGRIEGLLALALATITAPSGAETGAPEGADAGPAVARPELPGGIYDKPYLSGRGRVALGGYIDHELEWVEDGGSTFDQHRFIPFITSALSDRIHVSAEIEFEHGGFVSGDAETDGEVKLEYAVLDFEIDPAFVYRGGVILSPLGAFNLLHDSPLNDLTERPLVSRQLVPTTLSEAGMGFFGTLYPSESVVMSYELYAVNGFDEGIIDGEGESARLRVRGGRGSQGADNNDSKSLVARVGVSPSLGSNIGLSVHTGRYDDADEHALTIAAADARVTRGVVELQGEAAMVEADVAPAHTGAATSQRGGYAQINAHVLHDAVMPGSVFTAVLRGDAVDFDADLDGDVQTALTAGINFRPVEDTVFKLDYTWSWTSPRGGGDAEAGPDRLFFSFASYF